MQKLLLLSIAISCISSSPATSDGATTSHNSNVFQTTETDSFNGNQAKDRYYRNVRYATYIAGISFIANLAFLVSPKHKDISQLCLAICAISSFLGFSNMLKWLTVHIWPAKQASDIYCIDISEKLILTFLAVTIQMECERMLKINPNFFNKK